MPALQGYCVVCQAKRELRDTQQIERSGLPAVEGKCTVCGAKIFVLGATLPDGGSAPA